jgi:hypothetical protein
MRRARRIIRRLLIVVLFLTVLCLVGLGVLNYWVLPRYGAGWVKAGLERFLGRTVRFEQIDWNVLRGATISGVVVEHRSDVRSDAPFLEAERLDVSFRITSLIPFRVELKPDLDAATVRLVKSAGGEWNISDIVERLSRRPVKTPTARVRRLSFSRMTIVVEDRHADLPQQSVEDVSCVLMAPPNGLNHLQLGGRWRGGTGRLTLDATFGPDTQPLLKIGLGGPVICELQQLLAPQGPLFAHEIEGLATISLTRTDEGKLTGKARMDFSHANLEVEGFHIAGRMTGTINEITVTPGDEPALALTGAVALDDGRVEYIPQPRSEAVGEAVLSNIRDVEHGPTPAASTGPGGPVPQMTFEGDGNIGLLVAGTIGERLSVTVSCSIGNAQVTTPALNAPFEAIGGRVTYDGTGLKYEDVVGEIAGAVVTVNGALDAFGEPNITFDVQGDRIGGNARVKIRHVNGQDLPAFQVDGAGWMDAPLAKLIVPPNVAAVLDRLQITGMVLFDGRIARVEPGLDNVRVRGQIGGTGLGVRGFGFDGVSGTVYLERGLLKVYGLDGVLYDGRFTGAWEGDFAGEGKPFKLDAELRDVQIARLPLLTHVENRQLRGRLGTWVHVNGLLDDLSKNTGKGRFRLRNGYLWELDVFAELFNVLSVRMPGLFKAVFVRARGDFQIEGLALTTHNLYFESDILQLLMDGSVDLNGNLDVVVDPLFLRERGGPIRNLFRQILNIPANIIPRALIKGTVTDPVVKPYLRPRLPILKEIVR